MKSFQSIAALTPEAREKELKTTVSGATDRQKSTAKILHAMVTAGDVDEKSMNARAIEITGKDIRREMQGVYELKNVFEAVIAGKIAMTEEQFDAGKGSIIALISPFLKKPELQPMLAKAVEMVIAGATADEIRKLKPETPKKEPKAVKEMREKLEAKDKEIADKQAEIERMHETYTGYRVPVQFAVVDLAEGAPLITSASLNKRISSDASSDAAFHAEYFLRRTLAAIQQDPSAAATIQATASDCIQALFESLTKTAKGKEKFQTIEVAA